MVAYISLVNRKTVWLIEGKASDWGPV